MGKIDWVGGVFYCEDDVSSHFITRDILLGLTYPRVPFASRIRAIVDVGANIGAAACYFARLYPEAVVYALEPSPEAFVLCSSNVDPFSNVSPEHIGLHAFDGTADLYLVPGCSSNASLHETTKATGGAVTVPIRAAATWARDRSLDRIDILKIDTEGSEVPILESFGQLLETVQVLYIEYHSDDDRRVVDQMVAHSHVLGYGAMYATTGEATYLSRAILPSRSDLEAWVRDVFIAHRPSIGDR